MTTSPLDIGMPDLFRKKDGHSLSLIIERDLSDGLFRLMPRRYLISSPYSFSSSGCFAMTPFIPGQTIPREIKKGRG
jgi:hypothetical protein